MFEWIIAIVLAGFVIRFGILGAVRVACWLDDRKRARDNR